MSMFVSHSDWAATIRSSSDSHSSTVPVKSPTKSSHASLPLPAASAWSSAHACAASLATPSAPEESMNACDALYDLDLGAESRAYGATCGGRIETTEWCSDLYGLGYEYSGRLVNNCDIYGQFEDMNIWVKLLEHNE